MSKQRRPEDASATAKKAVSHKVRRAFMRRLRTGDGPLSPSAFAGLENVSLSTASYHARTLASLGVTECAERIQRRGAIETRYSLGGPHCETALQMLGSEEQEERPPSSKG